MRLHILAIILGIGIARAQLFRWQGVRVLTPSSWVRMASAWLRDSFWVDLPASGGGWQLDSLVVSRYLPGDRPAWDSCYKWNSSTNRWELVERYGYYYYSSGNFTGYDSVKVRYAPLNPSDRQHFFYSDLGGGRIQVEIRDSTFAGGGGWNAGSRYIIWGSRAQLEAGGEPDSLWIQVFSGGSWQTAIRFYNFFSGNRLDSSFVWVNVRYLQNLPYDVIVGGYTRYHYDASNRLNRRRDTLWLESPMSGPAQAGWTWYFYTGNASHPYKDSTAVRDYGSGDSVSLAVTFYTYDTNNNLTVAVEKTCSSSNPTNCQDNRRRRYSYYQVSTSHPYLSPSSRQIVLLSPVCRGCQVSITLEHAMPYKIIDIMGRVIAEGQLSPGMNVLSMPTLSGVYTVQIGSYSQKVLVLP